MATFNLKKWLDSHVVPFTQRSIPLHIYSFIWNGDPPNEVLVWVHTGLSLDSAPAECRASDPGSDGGAEASEAEKDATESNAGLTTPGFDPRAWPMALKQLLEEDGFRFDFLREQALVQLLGGTVTIFGGDGAPLYNAQGMASARLFRKEDDGVSLILQVGCQYPSGKDAAAATKGFYQSFDESPLEVCQKFGTVFGQA